MVQHTQGDDPLAPLTEEPSVELRDGGDVDCDPVALDLKVQEQLGKVFRAYCDDLIHQPVPEKFVVLLAKLEAKQRVRR